MTVTGHMLRSQVSGALNYSQIKTHVKLGHPPSPFNLLQIKSIIEAHKSVLGVTILSLPLTFEGFKVPR